MLTTHTVASIEPIVGTKGFVRDDPVVEVKMAWLILGIAGILEVAWAYAMKLSNGFTRLTPTVIMVVTMLGSFFLLAAAMRQLPLGTAYMVWTGIGAVGAFLMGVLFLGESLSPMRIAAAVLILSGIILMKLSS